MNKQLSVSRFWRLHAVSFSLLLTLAFSGCRQEDPPPGQRDCTTYGTLVRVICGTSVLDNYWIKLDNGELLQPCQSDIVYFAKPNYYEGQRVKFGYMAIKSNACPSVITCMAVPPPHTVIRITCFETVGCPPPYNGCKLTGTVRDFSRTMGPIPCGWMIVADNGANIIPHNLPAGFVLSDGLRVSFSYTPLYTADASCMGATHGKITCIQTMPNTFLNTH